MITLHRVSKSFSQFDAVKDVSLHIDKGEIYGIIGASGAGKSTLLRLMNMLELPTSGEIEVNGQSLKALNQSELRRARHAIGMIFQHFNLVANKKVFDNVALPLELVGMPSKERKQRTMECLQFVGLEHLINKYPAQLSGGQKQRVAIARALANNPHVLLCDEPTSSLDSSTSSEILSVLQKINQTLGVTIVMVSHEMDVIKSICQRVAIMNAGELHSVIPITPQGIRQQDKSPESLIAKLLERSDS